MASEAGSGTMSGEGLNPTLEEESGRSERREYSTHNSETSVLAAPPNEFNRVLRSKLTVNDLMQ
jgi:hypothetical protein